MCTVFGFLEPFLENLPGETVLSPYIRIIIIGNLESAFRISKRFTTETKPSNAQIPIIIQISSIQAYKTYEN